MSTVIVIPPSITYLDYSNNNIKQIADSFTGHTNLQSLKLSGNTSLGDLNQDFINGSGAIIAFKDSITPTDKTVTIKSFSDTTPIKIEIATSYANECGILESEVPELNTTISRSTSPFSARQLCNLTNVSSLTPTNGIIPESFGKLKNLESISVYNNGYGNVKKLSESI